MRMRTPAVAVWIVLCALASLIVARAHYTADLSAFLPAAPTAAQRFLVEQLREGPASQLILIAIEGADAPHRTALSRALTERLRVEPSFKRVLNGESSGLASDEAFVFRNRYLLSSRVTAERFSVDGLKSAIADGIDELASTTGMLTRDLYLRDPTGETLEVLTQLNHASSQPRTADGVWVSRDDTRALLMAQTRAVGSDTDAQQRAIETIRRAFAQAATATPASATASVRLSGPGVFAVNARATIEHDAIRLSLFSALLISVLLLLVYRSLSVLVLGLLPVATGALAGVAAVALGFGTVHGVTLGFGVTLIGESVDYSIYLFIQSREGATAAWIRRFWPTIRLGMLTSVVGFASLLPSKFPGLAQLGMYSIAGLVAAALVTRYVLTALLPRNLNVNAAAPIGRAFSTVLTPLRRARGLLWMAPVLALVTIYLHRDHLWNRELSALNPVSAADTTLDGELRADLAAPDVRTLIVLSGGSSESVLKAAEVAGAALESLVSAGVIAGYQSPSDYLPSQEAQRVRRDSLPPATDLKRRLAAATASLPVQAARLAPFLQDVEAARTGALIDRDALSSTSIAAGVDALLIKQDARWNAVIPLEAVRTGPTAYAIDVQRVNRALGGLSTPGVDVTVLDLKQASDDMYSGYLSEATRLSLAGLAAILLLVLIALRSIARTIRVVVPLLLAVLSMMAFFAVAGISLTILHLIGLLLIVAIGSNYALFFERDPKDAQPESAAPMLASLLVANLTTVIGFGALSLSSIPVLAALGSTVAPGAFLSLLFAAMLARSR